MRVQGDSFTAVRVAVLYNIDWARDPGSPSYEADADVKKTAESIASALERGGHRPFFLTVDSELEPLAHALRADHPELVFNLVESLGGAGGREAEIPELLESLHIRYTGNSSRALRIATAKEETRRVLLERGVLVAPGFVVADPSALARIDLSAVAWPLFVKPARTDASIGIDQNSVVRDANALRAKVEYLSANYPGPYLVEEYLPGREVNVAIFPEPVHGNFVCTEIDFYGFREGQSKIVTYDCKWKPGTADYQARSVPLAGRIEDAKLREAQQLARAAFLAIGASSYGRVDLRIGRDGRFYAIDVNPNPDISSDAGLAIAASSIGVTHDQLIAGFVEAACR